MAFNYWYVTEFGNLKCQIFLFLYHVTAGDLDGAKEALSKMKYYVTNSEMLHPLLPDE